MERRKSEAILFWDNSKMEKFKVLQRTESLKTIEAKVKNFHLFLANDTVHVCELTVPVYVLPYID